MGGGEGIVRGWKDGREKEGKGRKGKTSVQNGEMLLCASVMARKVKIG